MTSGPVRYYGFNMIPSAGSLESVDANLVPIFASRDALRRASQPEAPIADASWPEQDWCVPDAIPDANGNTAFFRLPKQGEGTGLVEFVIPTARARVYNLPGVPLFKGYEIPDLGVTFSNGGGVNPQKLSTRDQALELFLELELGGTVEEEKGPSESVVYVYPEAETRRWWNIRPPWPNAIPINVGELLSMKNGHGVGLPMHWDLTNPQTPFPVFETINTATAKTRVLWPARPIPEGYRIFQSMFGQAIYVKG